MAALAALALTATTVLGTPGTGVVVTAISRATFTDAIDSAQQSGLQSVIQQLTIAPGGHTGWHSHPGGTVINVDSGQFTLYNDACARSDYLAGAGAFEMGGHTQLARNEGTTPLVLTVVYLDVPVGGATRSNTAIPACAGVGNDLPTTNAGSGVSFGVLPSGEIARATFAAGLSVDAAAGRDVFVQHQTYAAGAHTGWHSHPGATMIFVESGTFSFYMDDCVKRDFTAGQGVIEMPGMSAIARNEGSAPTVIRVVYFDVPVGGSPRIDQPEPSTCTGLAAVPSAAPSAAASAAASSVPNTAAAATDRSSAVPILAGIIIALGGLGTVALLRSKRREA